MCLASKREIDIYQVSGEREMFSMCMFTLKLLSALYSSAKITVRETIGDVTCH